MVEQKNIITSNLLTPKTILLENIFMKLVIIFISILFSNICIAQENKSFPKDSIQVLPFQNSEPMIWEKFSVPNNEPHYFMFIKKPDERYNNMPNALGNKKSKEIPMPNPWQEYTLEKIHGLLGKNE